MRATSAASVCGVTGMRPRWRSAADILESSSERTQFAIAFGFGGLLDTAASDLAHWLLASPAAAYSTVFFAEALLFVVAAALAWRIQPAPLQDAMPAPSTSTTEPTMATATAR